MFAGFGLKEGGRGGWELRCIGTGLRCEDMADLFVLLWGTIGYVFYATAGDGAQEGSNAGAAGEGRGEAAAWR